MKGKKITQKKRQATVNTLLYFALSIVRAVIRAMMLSAQILSGVDHKCT